eukprot:9643674-Alexandrium_andersonii.AAC.1
MQFEQEKQQLMWQIQDAKQQEMELLAQQQQQHQRPQLQQQQQQPMSQQLASLRVQYKLAVHKL